MEGALEGAAALCTCKLALSLLFLPRLPAPRGPVGLCCCCLLLFTDAAVTGESSGGGGPEVTGRKGFF